MATTFSRKSNKTSRLSMLLATLFAGSLAVGLSTGGLGGCGTGGQAVRSEEMSAEGHRAEAAKERRAADDHTAQWNPAASQPSPFRNPIDSSNDYLYGVQVYNPTEWHLSEADRHRAHARQHEAAANKLEHFESAECKDLPPTTRAACPLLGPAVEIADIPGGVRVRMSPKVRVDAVVAHMRCHLAFARAQGFNDAEVCPLYMPGLKIDRGTEPDVVNLTESESWRVPELRRHANEQVVIVRDHK